MILPSDNDDESRITEINILSDGVLFINFISMQNRIIILYWLQARFLSLDGNFQDFLCFLAYLHICK